MSDYGGPTPPDPNQPGESPSDFPPPPFGQTPFGQPQAAQPQYGQPVARPTGAPPPNYLVWAILSTLFCCLPLGIVSIVYAAQVNTKFAAGDVAGAQDSSAKAKQFAIWSAIAGVIVGVIYGIAVAASS
jgi:predicted secreted protein